MQHYAVVDLGTKKGGAILIDRSQKILRIIRSLLPSSDSSKTLLHPSCS